MEITVTTHNARVPVEVMHVTGNIDSTNYQIFQQKGDELIEKGARFLLLDFTNLTYTSSAGLRTIHNLFNKLRALHKDADDEKLRREMSAGAYKSPYIKVAGLSSTIREAFELSGFETYIEIHEDATKALESF